MRSAHSVSIASGNKLIFRTLYSAVCLLEAVSLEKDSRNLHGLLVVPERATPWTSKTTSNLKKKGLKKHRLELIKLILQYLKATTHLHSADS